MSAIMSIVSSSRQQHLSATLSIGRVATLVPLAKDESVPQAQRVSVGRQSPLGGRAGPFDSRKA